MRLIDADAITYTMMYKESWLKGEGHEASAVWKETIDKMPTVDAVPVRRGHWVGIDDEPCEVWECDVCGYIYETDSKLHRYCPNCGADMRGEDSEHE